MRVKILRWIKMNDGTLQTHGDVRMASGAAFRWVTRDVIDEIGNWVIVGVDASDGVAAFVLQTRKCSPFVND